MNRRSLLVASAAGIAYAAVGGSSSGAEPKEAKKLEFKMRSMVKADVEGGFAHVRGALAWDPQHTALIIVDMWDDHWCKGAAARVTELAPAIDNLAKTLRERGALVIHAPSTCVDFYKDTAARKRAIAAPQAKSPIELATSERWGTAWCWPDKKREGEFPIDDSDMGCDCKVKCKIEPPWKRQIASIAIDQERDAITDNGQELVNLFAAHKIDHVVICGVHLNMCVLGRPMGIRQLTHLKKDVVLVRDLTDTMYNHEMKPFVDHFAGTDLVVEHVEKYWCPTTTSAELVGGKAFRFKEDVRK